MKSLIPTCRYKLGVCTRKVNETKALLVEFNVDQVNECINIFLDTVDKSLEKCLKKKGMPLPIGMNQGL